MIAARSARVVVLFCLVACGGRAEEVSDKTSPPQAPPIATPDVRVEVSGTVTLVQGKEPGTPITSGPAARRVVLVKPGGRFSLRVPRLIDADIAVEAESTAEGVYSMWAPPGDYFIFAINGTDTLANGTMHTRTGGEVAIRLEVGKVSRRDLVVYAVKDRW